MPHRLKKHSKRIFYTLIGLAFAYIGTYAFFRASGCFVITSYLEPGHSWIIYNWRESDKFTEDEKDWLKNVDDWITRNEAETSGGIVYFWPLVFVEENIRGFHNPRSWSYYRTDWDEERRLLIKEQQELSNQSLHIYGNNACFSGQRPSRRKSPDNR